MKFPAELQALIDQASADGVISDDERKLIMSYARKVGVAEELVLMQLTQFQSADDVSDYEISDEELIRRIGDWIARLEKGTYKGVREPFPKKVGQSSNLLEKGGDMLGKTVEAVNKVPGLGMTTKLGLKVATSVLSKQMDVTQMSFEIDRYLAILRHRAEEDKILTKYIEELDVKFSSAKDKAAKGRSWF